MLFFSIFYIYYFHILKQELNEMESDFYESAIFHIDREEKSHSSMPSRHYHNMNEIHKLVNSSGATFERIILEFKKEFIDDIFPNQTLVDLFSSFGKGQPMVKLSGQEQTFIEKHFDTMIREYTQRPPGYEFYLKTLLFELLLFIYRKQDSNFSPASKEVNLVHKKIFEIVDYINLHYNEQQTIQQISKRFYISPSYFCKTFRENTGFTFTEYLNNVRIKEGCTLLTHGNDKVATIAQKVGFESLTHFGRMFKEITGMSPLKYRQNYRVN
jgi:YesN/AraC family two-component response regulator